jgi:DNA-binding Lrp family transcriptional regulator
MEGRFAMANNRRSAIVDLLASKGKPMSTKAIAEALGVDAGVMGTRVRQLEESGKLAPVGTATRTRDVRWIPADPDVIGRRPKIAISYRAAENIEAMRAAALERMLEGKPANWVQEPDEVTA